MYVEVPPQTIGRLVAFFPDTFSHRKFGKEIDLKSPYVTAYWQDFHKNGRHRASFGVVELNMRMTDSVKPLDELNFGDILELSDPDTVNLISANTISNFGKDFNRHLYFTYPNFSEKYDRLDLRLLLNNPAALPGASVGWFKVMNRKHR